MSWKNLRGNIPNKSYFSNVDCLDGEFVRSSLLKAYFGVPSLTQLYLFCHAFVAKQLDKYISFCSISKNLTHFKTKLVGDDCNKTQQNWFGYFSVRKNPQFLQILFGRCGRSNTSSPLLSQSNANSKLIMTGPRACSRAWLSLPVIREKGAI